MSLRTDGTDERGEYKPHPYHPLCTCLRCDGPRVVRDRDRLWYGALLAKLNIAAVDEVLAEFNRRRLE